MTALFDGAGSSLTTGGKARLPRFSAPPSTAPSSFFSPIFDDVLEKTNDGIFLFSLSGILLKWNRSAEILTGLTKEKVTGRPIAEIIRFPWKNFSEFFEQLEKKGIVLESTIGATPFAVHYFAMRDEKGVLIGAWARLDELQNEARSLKFAQEQSVREIAEANELRHRHLINAIPQIVWTSLGDGAVEFLNEHGRSFTGLSGEGRNLKNWRRVIHRSDRKKVWHVWREALNTRNSVAVECRLKRADDASYRRHKIQFGPMKSISDDSLKWAGVCLDIEDQKRTEEKLRKREFRFETMLDTAPVMLWLSDSGASLTFFNKQWLEFTGRTFSQDVGFGWKENIHPEDVEKCFGNYLTSFEKRESYRLEYRMRRHDGVYCWILEAGVPRYGTHGEFLGYIGSCIDISQQKETEAKLRQSEERYRLVARSTNDTIWDWDLLTNHVDRSESRRHFWGDQLEATASRIQYWHQAMHPDDRERVWESIHFAIENRVQRWSEEYRYQKCDGSYAYVSDRGFLLYDSTGRPVRMIGAMTDITERKLAQEELEHSEMRYRLAARATSHAIWEWDLTNNRIRWSDAVMTTFHYKVEELGPFAEWWYEHIHPEDRDRVVKGIQKAISDLKQHWSDEYRFLCGNKKYASVIDRGFVVHDATGKPVRMIGAMMDITERISAEAQSRRFKFISDNSNDAHFLMDEEGCFLYANNVACERLGYQREELLQQPIEKIDRAVKNRVLFLQQFKNREKLETILFETEHLTKGGKTVPVEVSAVLVTFEGQSHIFMVARDVTERKRAEQALKTQAEELARSNAELQQFAYVASHDLQEPLRMVNSYLTLLARRYGSALDHDAHDYIRFAVDGALRMHALVNDLLIYSRVGTRDRKVHEVNLNDAFAAAVANLRPAIEESGAVVESDGLPTIIADKIQMTQLFQNLIGNAIKFRGKSLPVVKVQATKKFGEWILSVSDNGIGIEQRFANRIFVIFQRLHTRDEYPGTGIGLAICKKIVERHHGKIWVDPTPPGTTFRFTLKA